MATGYEVQMYNDISIIAQSLRRIADALEKPPAARDDPYRREGKCKVTDCNKDAIVIINGDRYCQEHLGIGFGSNIGIVAQAIRTMGEGT